MAKRDKAKQGEPFRGRGNAGAMRMHVSPDDHRYPDMMGPIDIAPSGFVDRGGGRRSKPRGQDRRAANGRKAGNRATAGAVGTNETDGKQMSEKRSTKKRSRA